MSESTPSRFTKVTSSLSNRSRKFAKKTVLSPSCFENHLYRDSSAFQAYGSGSPAQLSQAELSAFDSYLRERKPAGVLLQTASYSPDVARVVMSVQYDPQVITSEGKLIADPSVYPVEDAVNNYLHNIVYGGALNKTKLVDAVQQAPGVVDVSLTSVSVKTAAGDEYMAVVGNNYVSVGGSFVSNNLRNGISYVLSL